MIIINRAKKLSDEFQKIRKHIDEVSTPNLSKIKEILKRIHFADIESDKHIQDNRGTVYYKQYTYSDAIFYSDIKLSYTIDPKYAGLAYGSFITRTDKDGNKKTEFKSSSFNNYVRFIADVTSHRVIYSKKLDQFIRVDMYSYTPINEMEFLRDYPVEKKNMISDFLEVMEELYLNHMQEPLHNYTVFPSRFAGKNWVYDCEELELIKESPKKNELYFAYYEVKFNELNAEIPQKFLSMIAEDEPSLHNLQLVHAYVMQRKLNLVPAEKWFLLKDFGRTGKGLLVETFPAIFKYKQVSFDSLKKAGSFEAQNEWANFYGAEIAHANETGEITVDDMRILRKIATSEFVTGRMIGQNTFRFKNEAVLVLDTNEPVDVGQITANVSRTVKIAFKDRARGEKEEDRHAQFKPYWDFIMPNGENSERASLSFLICSLNYLKANQSKFSFRDVTLKNYAFADDLTETQRILIEVIHEQGFIFSSDEILKKAIENDYGNLRYKNAQKDIKAIGVALNKPKWIDGQNTKVNQVGDKGLFEAAVKLLNDENS